MTGLDTNVLLRWLIRSDVPSDRAQGDLAAEAIGSGGIHVGLVVLIETVWVLSGRYGLGRAAISDVLDALLAHPNLRLERRADVEKAATAHRMGGPGFADHLIGACHAADGCRTTLTFDKRAAGSDHFTHLT